MQIGTPLFNPFLTPTEPKPVSENNAFPATTSPRQRRSVDYSPPKNQELVQEVKPAPESSGGGFEEVIVNPDPGKNVGNVQKVPVPVDLGLNINVDPVTQEVSKSFKTVSEEASIFLKKKFAERAQKAKTPEENEKWNIDPDNTFLVTFDYNTTGEKPYPAKIIQRISLTQALIQNAQDTPKGSGYTVPFYLGGPEVIVKPDLKTIKPGFFDFSSRFSPNNEHADITHTYQGIYRGSAEEPATAYNAENQSPIAPKEFKELIWKADFQKPYKEFLDEFWSSHKEKYPILAKASFVKSAMAQHQEGSLSAEGRDLIMRAAGLSGHQESWPDIKYEYLQKNPSKDPNIEVGLLKLGNYPSTDLMYITDTKVKHDAAGKKIPPLTLLYIPGNSSPVHSFTSQAEMKTWLAGQMADPVKREAMAAHFALKDKPNGYAHAGIDETLAGLGTWPNKRETPGGLFSYDHRAFTGFWNPQDFIKTEPNSLPFDEVAKRQKDRSYADADVKITTDGDVTKNHILSGLEKASKAALFLTPLALVVPEVALALDAFYLMNGATTAGIGVDDTVHGKPEGTRRIVFGVFNAIVVVAPRAASLGRNGEGAIPQPEHPEIEPAAPQEPETPPAPKRKIAPPEEKPFEPQSEQANRVRPSQWKEIDAYAVPQGEQLTKNLTPNARGIYQFKDAEGEDRWFIKLKNDKGAEQVFEISSTFKLRDGYAQIIAPNSRKPLMTVHSTGNGQWEPLTGPGGIRLPWGSNANAKKQLDEMIANIEKPRELLSEPEKQAFSNELVSLMNGSKAEQFQSMSHYTEAGSDEINSVLRTQTDPGAYPKNVKDFLSDLKQQADYEGMAYRYSYISPEGAKKLKSGVGKVFRDPGVQSASIQPTNVKEWGTWAKSDEVTKGSQPVIYAFDEYVPKKNLASGTLPDHVAVPPDASLEVVATKEKDGILYVYLTAPAKMPKQRYNLFDGTVARPF